MISQMSNAWIKNVLHSWQSSLSLLIPKNLKLFFLVTLNAVFKGLQVFFTYWGWFFILNCSIFFYGLSWMHEPNAAFLIAYILFSAVGMFICLILYILSSRPSLALKDYAYFKNYKGHIFNSLFLLIVFGLGAFFLTTISLLILMALGIGVLELLKTGIMGSFPVAQLISFFKYAFLPFVGLFGYPMNIFFVSPLFITAIFFLFDLNNAARSLIKSIASAVKMIWYNMPLYYISYAVFLLLQKGLVAFLVMIKSIAPWYFFNVVFGVSLTTLFYAFYVAWFMNIYIKRLHDQYNIYGL